MAPDAFGEAGVQEEDENPLRFEKEWVDCGPNKSKEELATLCYLQIWLGSNNTCRFLDAEGRYEWLLMPAVNLAEGLALDWWSIFGKRDYEHSLLLLHRRGYLVPDLVLDFDGSRFRISNRGGSWPEEVHFYPCDPVYLSEEEFRSTLSGFIEDVASRLRSKGIEDSTTASRWSKIEESLGDLTQTLFCEAAGALELDPYFISEADERFIEGMVELFREREPLIEFLSGLSDHSSNRRRIKDWIGQMDARSREESELPGLREIAEQVGAYLGGCAPDRPWAIGYRAAKEFRSLFRGSTAFYKEKSGFSFQDLSSRLGSPEFTAVDSDPLPGIFAMGSSGEGTPRVHLRKRASQEDQNFDFARAVGYVACFPDSSRFVINNLHRSNRQAVTRAFAAELLAPGEIVSGMHEEGHDPYLIADRLGVPTQVVQHQLENSRRIAAV